MVTPKKSLGSTVLHMVVFFPDTSSREEKDLMTLGHFLDLASSEDAHQHSCAETYLGSDWSAGLHGQFKLIYTMLLYSCDQSCNLIGSGHQLDQAVCPKSPDPFSLAEGGIWGQDYA